MSQLQTVLDALTRYRTETPLGHQPHMITDLADEAIAIVKQMMQAEPVACLVETEQGVLVWPIDDFNEAGTYCDPDEFPQYLYTQPAPQEVPAGWVSLEDGMPSPHQMVLVARGPHITTGSYTPAFGWAWEEVDGEDEDSIATHWMPLPAAPKVAA